MVTSLKLLFDRPIFETEEMNTHIEVLGEIQLASELLAKLLKMENVSTKDKIISRRGDIFSNRIGSLIKQIRMGKEKSLAGGYYVRRWYICVPCRQYHGSTCVR